MDLFNVMSKYCLSFFGNKSPSLISTAFDSVSLYIHSDSKYFEKKTSFKTECKLFLKKKKKPSVIIYDNIIVLKSAIYGENIIFLFLLPTNAVGHLNCMFNIYCCKNILRNNILYKILERKKG